MMTIIKDIKDRVDAVKEVDDDLQAVSDWGKKWKVEFEPTKTHALLCTRVHEVVAHELRLLVCFFGRTAHSDSLTRREIAWESGGKHTNEFDKRSNVFGLT